MGAARAGAQWGDAPFAGGGAVDDTAQCIHADHQTGCLTHIAERQWWAMRRRPSLLHALLLRLLVAPVRLGGLALALANAGLRERVQVRRLVAVRRAVVKHGEYQHQEMVAVAVHGVQEVRIAEEPAVDLLRHRRVRDARARQRLLDQRVGLRLAWALLAMLRAMEPVAGECLDLLQLLLGAALLKELTRSVVDVDAQLRVEVDHLLQRLDDDGVVFRVFHRHKAQDAAGMGIHVEQPPVFEVRRLASVEARAAGAPLVRRAVGAALPHHLAAAVAHNAHDGATFLLRPLFALAVLVARFPVLLLFLFSPSPFSPSLFRFPAARRIVGGVIILIGAVVVHGLGEDVVLHDAAGAPDGDALQPPQPEVVADRRPVLAVPPRLPLVHLAVHPGGAPARRPGSERVQQVVLDEADGERGAAVDKQHTLMQVGQPRGVDLHALFLARQPVIGVVDGAAVALPRAPHRLVPRLHGALQGDHLALDEVVRLQVLATLRARRSVGAVEDLPVRVVLERCAAPPTAALAPVPTDVRTLLQEVVVGENVALVDVGDSVDDRAGRIQQPLGAGPVQHGARGAIHDLIHTAAAPHRDPMPVLQHGVAPVVAHTMSVCGAQAEARITQHLVPVGGAVRTLGPLIVGHVQAELLQAVHQAHVRVNVAVYNHVRRSADVQLLQRHPHSIAVVELVGEDALQLRGVIFVHSHDYPVAPPCD
eukprot:gene5279-biopygen4190